MVRSFILGSWGRGVSGRYRNSRLPRAARQTWLAGFFEELIVYKAGMRRCFGSAAENV
jgi:hypothetical protein